MFGISGIIRVLITQYVLVLILCAGSAFFVGSDGAWTALFTGLAYALPTSLLAIFLMPKTSIVRDRLGSSAILIGEFVKVLMIVIGLVLIVNYYENLRWSVFILTLITLANSYLLVLFKRN